MNLIHWDARNDGPLTEDAMRRKLEKLGYSAARYTYPPGTYFPDHTHAIDKMDAVISGRFRMTTPAGEAILEAGDCLAVPKGTVHSAEVVGDEPVVSLDAVKE